jgi:hypothetical protein
MAVVRFTPEDIQRARDPLAADTTTVAAENALDCDGWRCGWCCSHGDDASPPPHAHLVIRGDGGCGGERVLAIFFKA